MHCTTSKNNKSDALWATTVYVITISIIRIRWMCIICLQLDLQQNQIKCCILIFLIINAFISGPGKQVFACPNGLVREQIEQVRKNWKFLVALAQCYFDGQIIWHGISSKFSWKSCQLCPDSRCRFLADGLHELICMFLASLGGLIN